MDWCVKSKYNALEVTPAWVHHDPQLRGEEGDQGDAADGAAEVGRAKAVTLTAAALARAAVQKRQVGDEDVEGLASHTFADGIWMAMAPPLQRVSYMPRASVRDRHTTSLISSVGCSPAAAGRDYSAPGAAVWLSPKQKESHVAKAFPVGQLDGERDGERETDRDAPDLLDSEGQLRSRHYPELLARERASISTKVMTALFAPPPLPACSHSNAHQALVPTDPLHDLTHGRWLDATTGLPYVRDNYHPRWLDKSSAKPINAQYLSWLDPNGIRRSCYEKVCVCVNV